MCRRLCAFSYPFVVIALLLASFGGTAHASSKQVIAYFGTENGTGSLGGQFTDPGDIAVNSSGAGPANKGEIYVLDGSRIERFAQNDNGTPAEPYDDRYEFVSTWGAGVNATLGGNDYQICSVASSCQAGLSSGGNGTPAGNGSMSGPRGIAVDQETGLVYLSDAGNNRVNVYGGDGTFVQSFGFDVVASGPDNSGAGYERCIVSVDICKAGVPGSGVGQISSARGIAVSPASGSPATRSVFLADAGSNTRVDTYGLDGASPASFGSSANFEGSPEQVAVDSRGIVYASDRQNSSEVERYDTKNANGVGVGFLAPISAPPLSTVNTQRKGLEVDPDSDGPEPETDVLYVLRDGASGTTVVQQFGPVNSPGLTAPPTAVDDVHGAVVGFNFVTGLGFDESNGRLFVSTLFNIGGPSNGVGNAGVYVLDVAGGAPSASLDSVNEETATGATIHATVEPNGPPDVTYHLEYSLDGTSWTSTPEVLVGRQTAPQTITARLEPPGGGLEPGTLYHVRLVATKVFTPPVVTSIKTFTTLPAPPIAETTGSPVRSATTARFEGRVNPRGAATNYNFEYVDHTAFENGGFASPATKITPVRLAGSGSLLVMVAEEVEGLRPNTVYDYRLVADNGKPGSPAKGDDVRVLTRSSDTPLSHGHFPGPPGSDRAWEQVNPPDTGGNPVIAALDISDDGDRVAYQLPGGTHITDSGSGFSLLFAQRGAGGWQSQQVLPPRNQVAGPNWLSPFGTGDLSALTSLNFNVVSGANTLWRLAPGGSPTKLLTVSKPEYGGFYAASDDGSAAIEGLVGSLDPEHPASPGTRNLYEVSSGAAHMVSLLPGGAVSPCGVQASNTLTELPVNFPRRTSHWVSADGSRVFFPSKGSPCSNQSQIYMRELDASQSKLISGPPLSGPSCPAAFLKSTPQAAFFWTRSRLSIEDTTVSGLCEGEGGTHGDVYRYDFSSGTLKCVSCLVPGLDTDVVPTSIAVAEDGSRVYFQSPHRLLAGAAPSGIYRVDVGSGDFRYIGALGGASISDDATHGGALSPDGSVLVFRSSDPSLNPLGGTDNGGTAQYYLYDDRDQSLSCVSCPQDGSPPAGAVPERMTANGDQVGANITPISGQDDFAFATPTSLANGDQNTADPGQESFVGTDVYEWRDGRTLLVSDGLANWPSKEITPSVSGVSPSGHDIFFMASEQLTPDALDGYQRLYDARIGGGFEFPKPPIPCPLEVCQGNPKGPPSVRPPGTTTAAGPTNPKPHFHRRKRHRAKSHRGKKHHHRRANHIRRAER